MSVIQNSLLTAITDRLAKQVQLILDGIKSAGAPGGGEHFERITASADYQVENDFIGGAYDWDKYISGQNVFPDIGKLSTYVNDFNTHATNRGAQDFDRLLQTSGIDVADYFADLYYWIRGNRLSGRNVFYSTALDPLATLTLVSSGISTFTDGYKLGTGSGSYTGRDDRTALETAAENLEAYVSGNGLSGGALSVNVTCKKEDTTTEVKTVAFSDSAPAWTLLDVGSSTDKYIDVTNAAISSGAASSGTVVVRSKVLRTISL